MGSSYENREDVLQEGTPRNYSGDKELHGVLYTRSIVVPEGAYWGHMRTGTSTTGVKILMYEVWCSEENLTGQEFSNSNLPTEFNNQ